LDPVTSTDAKTLVTVKTIDLQDGPDGILGDPFKWAVYVFSHGAPKGS
jgi:hypothetical protein